MTSLCALRPQTGTGGGQERSGHQQPLTNTPPGADREYVVSSQESTPARRGTEWRKDVTIDGDVESNPGPGDPCFRAGLVWCLLLAPLIPFLLLLMTYLVSGARRPTLRRRRKSSPALFFRNRRLRFSLLTSRAGVTLRGTNIRGTGIGLACGDIEPNGLHRPPVLFWVSPSQTILAVLRLPLSTGLRGLGCGCTRSRSASL